MSDGSEIVPNPVFNATDCVGLTRRLAFIELMELLEFSVLRLDPPSAGLSPAPLTELIGTQDWRLAEGGEAPPSSAERDEDHAVYIYSTTDALREAVLPAEDTLVRLDSAAAVSGDSLPSAPDMHGVRLSASARGPQTWPRVQTRARRPTLRVDLTRLLSRVVVPTARPHHMFELVQSVVRSRVWIDVVRA